jgi:hypothetical protein
MSIDLLLNHSANDPITKFKIKGLPKDSEYAALPFGRRIEYARAIEAFKASAQSTYLSQKRQSYTKAIREAIKLYGVTQYYCRFYCNANVKDDSFQFWYK